MAQRISRRGAILDAVKRAKFGAGHMRHLALGRPDPEVDLGLAEIDRLQLRMNVGDMDQAQVAECVEFQKLVLAQCLLRRQPGPAAKPARAEQRARRHRHLKKITPRDHTMPPVRNSSATSRYRDSFPASSCQKYSGGCGGLAPRV